jgi:hypothetical protein
MTLNLPVRGGIFSIEIAGRRRQEARWMLARETDEERKRKRKRNSKEKGRKISSLCVCV